MKKLIISTPARICLFGEHQDYLGLPVIACAITRRISFEASHRSDRRVIVDMRDIGAMEEFDLGEDIVYSNPRDYLKSSVNVLRKNGFSFSRGIDANIKSDIPINAGASSSSALTVGWINLLARLSDQAVELPQSTIAEYAHAAEVLEFGEPGGMMDHYATSVGGVIHLESHPRVSIEKLAGGPGAVVVGNSGEPKNTRDILSRVKFGVLDIVSKIKLSNPSFSLHDFVRDDLPSLKDTLNAGELHLLNGTLTNRDITREARKELSKSRPDLGYIGKLLNDHQEVLRDILKISTVKIDTMIQAALDAGAAGAKINGSGGGGTMFAIAPEDPEKVLRAVSVIAPDSFIVYSDEGTKAE